MYIYCRIGISHATKKADFSVFRVYFISRVRKFYSLVSAMDQLGVNFTLKPYILANCK